VRAHGTYAKAKKEGCGCSLCRDAARRYARRQSKRLVLYGPAYVDGEAARMHVQECITVGMTNHQVALLAALGDGGRTSVRHLLARGGRLRPETERALRAVPKNACAAVAGATCDATGARRRLQALVAIGYTERDLARRLGAGETSPLQVVRRARCRGETALAVARLYDELAGTNGPSDAARSRARLLGWLGPLWWDEDTIDDPTAAPPAREYESGGTIYRDLAAPRLNEVARLTRRGVARADIANRLGCSLRQVRRDQARLRTGRAS
jgi:hypothetical protein